MDLKFNFCVIFVYLSAINLVISLKYEFINDCIYIDKSTNPGFDELTFICSAIDREVNVFSTSNETYCSNANTGTLVYYDYRYMWCGTVDFQNCSFHQLTRNYFDMFKNMHTFNISNVELESMQLDIFRDASNVTDLDLSGNKLTEIPSHILFNARKLKFISFSNNAISRVDPMAFYGATDLRTLDLSHNHVSELIDSLTFSFLFNLVTLDLSYNNLTVDINEHIFDKLTNLELLNLSFNGISNLDIKIFSNLTKLKDLNLKGMNLSNIPLGTFSQQHKLVTLDLSGNRLTKLDFKLFLPVLKDLRSLRLENNQLKNLNGFKNKIFPQLHLLQIHGNPFSCAYLAHFMGMFDWAHIQLMSSDAHSTDLHDSNIRGIGCNDTDEGEPILMDRIDGTATIDHGYKIDSIDNGASGVFIEISLTFICVALTIFLILFVVVNSIPIYNQFAKALTFCQRIRTDYSSNGKVVEFTNERAFIP